MPFVGYSAMDLKREFARLASLPGANVSELCRRFGIGRTAGHELLARWRAAGDAGLEPRSRRPRRSPNRTPAVVEEAIVALRAAHPAWGAAKLAAALERRGDAAPAPSTVHAVLVRRGLVGPQLPRGPWARFERAAPNELWQIDFMGHRPLAAGGRVHPLVVLDDCSRFALTVAACPDERQATVRAALEAAFRRYGLPDALLADNGSPWGTAGRGGLTKLEVWLLRLGVAPRHGRAGHPQTQGKVERFHRTLAAEAFGPAPFADAAAAQRAFDRFRLAYNHHRPHAALDQATPIDRWRSSPRQFPEELPAYEYGPDDAVRRVRQRGTVRFAGRSWFVGTGLAGEAVAVRPTAVDGLFAVAFCAAEVARIDLRHTSPTPVRDVPE